MNNKFLPLHLSHFPCNAPSPSTWNKIHKVPVKLLARLHFTIFQSPQATKLFQWILLMIVSLTPKLSPSSWQPSSSAPLELLDPPRLAWYQRAQALMRWWHSWRSTRLKLVCWLPRMVYCKPVYQIGPVDLLPPLARHALILLQLERSKSYYTHINQLQTTKICSIKRIFIRMNIYIISW